VQASNLKAKSKKFAGLTDRVVRGIEENEELLISTEEARHIMHKRKHLSELVTERTAADERRRAAHFCEIVDTSRLHALAAQQARAILELQRERERWVKRSFPSFGPTHVAAAE
jgi:hypothetical protein